MVILQKKFHRLLKGCLAIIKGPPNDIYFIIEGPCDGYFTEKVSQAQLIESIHSMFNNLHI